MQLHLFDTEMIAKRVAVVCPPHYTLNAEKKRAARELLTASETRVKHELGPHSNPVLQVWVPKPGSRARYARRIIEIVCALHGLEVRKVLRKGRQPLYMHCRHKIIGLIYEKCCLPLEQIGRIVGGRNHGTVINAQQENFDLYCTKQEYAKMYDRCLQEIEKLEGTEIKMEHRYLSLKELV